MFMNIFYTFFSYIFFSYLLGSIPFGHIITKLSTKKNILEIGWRKTSGSNVFKNVGKWQGTLTGILDVLKGFLAVFLAQKLGFPLYIQALSGVAAVSGHNWSCFIRFAGGRGIGTLIGAFFALSPGILKLSLIPFVILALIWNASIGTILFLLTSIILGFYFQVETVVILCAVSLIPIFIKRLSPIRELKRAENRKSLFLNRLIFDNDKPCLDLRIKRIFKRAGWFG